MATQSRWHPLFNLEQAGRFHGFDLFFRNINHWIRCRQQVFVVHVHQVPFLVHFIQCLDFLFLLGTFLNLRRFQSLWNSRQDLWLNFSGLTNQFVTCAVCNRYFLCFFRWILWKQPCLTNNWRCLDTDWAYIFIIVLIGECPLICFIISYDLTFLMMIWFRNRTHLWLIHGFFKFWLVLINNYRCTFCFFLKTFRFSTVRQSQRFEDTVLVDLFGQSVKVTFYFFEKFFLIVFHFNLQVFLVRIVLLLPVFRW